ncbi:MAG: alpha/beta hydrolase family protein [Nitrospinota bacterium]
MRLRSRLFPAALALVFLLGGCAVTRFPSSEEGIVVERVFLKLSPMGFRGTELFVFRPVGKGPFPGVVLLHGEQPEPTGMPGGREFFYDGTGEFLASQGYAAMAPSMPGFGDSTGERDFVGPETLSRLRSAVRHFQTLPYVDSRRIAIYGASRGATAAALLARSIPEVRGLVLQSGLYDLLDVAQGDRKPEGSDGETSKEAREMRERIAREAGKSYEAMRKRSPAVFSKDLACPILLIHGTEDRAVSIDQMRRFAETLRREMGKEWEVLAQEVPAGHVVSGAIVWSEALPFLKRCLGKDGLARQRSPDPAKGPKGKP